MPPTHYNSVLLDRGYAFIMRKIYYVRCKQPTMIKDYNNSLLYNPKLMFDRLLDLLYKNVWFAGLNCSILPPLNIILFSHFKFYLITYVFNFRYICTLLIGLGFFFSFSVLTICYVLI